jgi:hypothetical protein
MISAQGLYIEAQNTRQGTLGKKEVLDEILNLPEYLGTLGSEADLVFWTWTASAARA